MKLTTATDFSEESFIFAEQFGVTHLKVNSTAFLDEHYRGVVQRDKLRTEIKRAKAHGLKIGVALLPQQVGSQHWNIRLGRPERDREIRDVCRSLQVLGGEGVPVVEYVFNLAAVAGNQYGPTARGGAGVRRFDYDWAKQLPSQPGFQATEEEVWDRITWFLERAVPAAEKAGVKLACHPDDPPVPTLCGETRVLGTFEGMKRLMDIVPSEANGLNFCQGTVAEMGVDVLEVIRYFGSRGRIHHVHFRNIKGALPKFDESFIDDGDVNMFDALKAYKEVGYTGTLMPDHWPQTVGNESWTAHAHALGYMKALMEVLGVLEG
jgi:mannonate dehydratase